jgi:hypothetical protein
MVKNITLKNLNYQQKRFAVSCFGKVGCDDQLPHGRPFLFVKI